MSKALAKVDDHQDKLMGEQLTAEFHEAVNGMTRVIRVGAMVMMLRARVLSNLDKTAATRGPTAKGKGLDSWLEKYAPKINRATAYRFEDVAKAVAQRYELPARVAKQLTFAQLVTTDPKDLDAAARKAQAELNGFVAGTSQRSWLDQFKEEGERGGDTSGKRKKQTLAEAHALFLKNAREDFGAAWSRVDALVLSGNWKAPSIKDAEIEETIDVAERYVKEARAWLNTPKKERTKS